MLMIYDTDISSMLKCLYIEYFLYNSLWRYAVKPKEELNDTEQEAFENDIVIPVRLRFAYGTDYVQWISTDSVWQ